ncbi:anti-sigma factor [Formosa sp. Hel1_33_131]|uniref:FecR family protein n=1 Tax=Formosa sp. Hel1_33_131 TaxID=1336794 RepID=UPI00084E1861|nr:FecR family protein [Formosa sp. Hel1_33_131]AOR28473.1 anti-sigma factor [Formosa sp. Hel1_33_131]
MSKKSQKLIIQFLTKQASFVELEALSTWLENPKNEKEFINYIKLNYAIDFNMKQFDAARSKKELQKFISKERRIRQLRKIRNLSKYAALLITFLGIGYLYQNNYFSTAPEFVIPSDSITLQLENGGIKVIHEDDSSKVQDAQGRVIGTQNGTQLVYSSPHAKEELAFNTLTVPYGKRFELQLSDGTKVHLNSGTSLKYPVKFIEGANRHVFLEGEAFFDVTSNKQAPFVVNAEDLNVEVFGTAFNVSAYPEDSSTDVVLVEGSVALYNENKTLKEGITIVPGTKGSLIKKQSNITTEKVDTELYTQWMKGGLIFRNSSFETISKKLERHYNVKIINTNEQLNKEVFNASFNEDTIEVILIYFQNSYNLEYKIEKNTIYID